MRKIEKYFPTQYYVIKLKFIFSDNDNVKMTVAIAFNFITFLNTFLTVE